MTGRAMSSCPLELRAHIANNTRDSIFVSLHFNATDHDPAATGFEIYSLTPRGAPSTYEDNLTLAAINIQNGSPIDTARSSYRVAFIIHSSGILASSTAELNGRASPSCV